MRFSESDWNFLPNLQRTAVPYDPRTVPSARMLSDADTNSTWLLHPKGQADTHLNEAITLGLDADSVPLGDT